MLRRRQLLPTFAILAGAGLLLAGVYHRAPGWLGMVGVMLLFAGGIWALRRNSIERRAAATAYWPAHDGVPPTIGDFSHGHHHAAGHHGAFDGGVFDSGGGGGFFDGGGGFDGGGDGGGG